MINLRGYVSSRNFFEYNPPQKVQNLVIRNYCNSKKINYLLSATEYSMKNSYLILNEFLSFKDGADGLVLYSLFQLPVDLDKRNLVFHKVLSNKKELHFALENLVLKKNSDIDLLNNLFFIKTSYDKCLSINDFKKTYNL